MSDCVLLWKKVFVKFSVNNSWTFPVAELTNCNSELDGKGTREVKCKPLKFILVYMLSNFFLSDAFNWCTYIFSPLVSDFTYNTVFHVPLKQNLSISIKKKKMFSVLYQQSTNYSVIRKWQFPPFQFYYQVHVGINANIHTRHLTIYPNTPNIKQRIRYIGHLRIQMYMYCIFMIWWLANFSSYYNVRPSQLVVLKNYVTAKNVVM